MVDLNSSDHLRTQVAFSTNPNDPAPAWQDLTSRTVLQAGIDISRGRTDEHDTVQPGRCILTFDNDDGALTPDNAGSAFYPNVLPQRRLRVSYRDPASLGLFNLLPDHKADIEAGSLPGSRWWTAYFGGSAGTTHTTSTTRSFMGSRSVLVTWPTAASPGSGLFMPGNTLVRGRTYVLSVPVFVPAGSPAVRWGDPFGATPIVQSTVTDRWQVLRVVFVAGAGSVFPGLRPATATTAGQQFWYDVPQLDEAAPGQFPSTSVDSGRLNVIADPRLVTATGWTAVNAGGGMTAVNAYSPNQAASVGDVWTVHVDIIAPGGTGVTGTVAARPTTGGVFGANPFTPTAFNVPAGTRQRISNTFTIPAGADGLRLAMGSVSVVDGSALIARAFMALEGAGGSFFAGDTLDDHEGQPVPGAGSIGVLGSATITPAVSFDGRTDWTRIDAAIASNGGRILYPAGSFLTTRQYRVDLEVANDTGASRSLSLDLCDGATDVEALAPGESRIVSAVLTPGANTDLTPTTYRFLDLVPTSVGSLLVRNVRVTPVASSASVWTASAAASSSQQFAYPVTAVSPTAAASGPAIVDLFDGFVEEWPVEWPTGGDTYSWAVVSAGDILSRLARAKELASVIAETIRLHGPTAHYPLGEQSGSASAGDRVGLPGTTALTIATAGTGSGTLEFGSGTGPGTDGQGAPVFTPASTANGQFLAGRIDGIGFFAASIGCDFATGTVAAQTLVRSIDPYGSYFEVGIDSTGHLTGVVYDPWSGTALLSLTSASVVTNNATHEARLVLQWDGASTVNGTLYLDGASAATGSYTGGPLVFCTEMTVGGHRLGNLFTGTIAHVVAFDGALTAAQVLEQRTAASTGFAGETSDQRISRIASWLGIPAALLELDACTTAIAHVDCTGMNPLDYMQQVAQTEAGVLFADRSGNLVLHSRSRLYSPSQPDVVIPGRLLDPATRPVENLQGVVNDLTGSRPGGGTTRLTDDDSVNTYQTLRDSVTMLVTTDAELVDAVSWRLAADSQPVIRVPDLTVDAFTEPALGANLRALEIGAHVALTDLPAQWGASVVEQTLQGYRLRIAPGVWDLSANTTNYRTTVAFVVEDDVFGTLDGPGVLVY